MDILADIVPGLAEAIERERGIREGAFLLDAPEFVCGVEVLPFTLEHMAWMIAIQSPFLCGGLPYAEDVALFLWAVSPQYTRAIALRERLGRYLGRFTLSLSRYLFVRRLRLLEMKRACDGINSYVDDALLDAPKGDGSPGGPSYWSLMASVVGPIACETGWSEKDILRMPAKRAWQYLKIAHKRAHPESHLFNPLSDGVSGKWLAERQRQDMERNKQNAS